MACTVKFEDGQTAVVSGGTWLAFGVEPGDDARGLQELLNARAQNDMPGPAEPDRDRYLAALAVRAYGGKIVSADEPRLEDGKVY